MFCACTFCKSWSELGDLGIFWVPSFSANCHFTDLQAQLTSDRTWASALLRRKKGFGHLFNGQKKALSWYLLLFHNLILEFLHSWIFVFCCKFIEVRCNECIQLHFSGLLGSEWSCSLLGWWSAGWALYIVCPWLKMHMVDEHRSIPVYCMHTETQQKQERITATISLDNFCQMSQMVFG